MEKRLKVRLKAFLSIAIISVAAVFLAAWVFENLVLKTTLHKIISSAIKSRTGASSVSMEIRRAGFTRSGISALKCSFPDGSELAVQYINAEYSLGDLFKGRISTLSLSGLELSCSLTKDGLQVKGIEAKSNNSSDAATGKAQEKSKLIPPLPFESLILRSSFLNFEFEGRKLQIPFDMDIKNSAEQCRVKLTLKPRGQKISAGLLYSEKDRKLLIEDMNGEIEPGLFDDWFSLLPQKMRGNGQLKFRLDSELNLSTLKPSLLYLHIALSPDFRLRYGHGEISGQAKSSIVLNAGASAVTFTAINIKTRFRDYSALLEDCSIKAGYKEKMTGEGKLSALLPDGGAFTLNAPFSIVQDDGLFKLTIKDSPILLKGASLKVPDCELSFSKALLNSEVLSNGNADIRLDINGLEAAYKTKYRLNADKLALQMSNSTELCKLNADIFNFTASEETRMLSGKKLSFQYEPGKNTKTLELNEISVADRKLGLEISNVKSKMTMQNKLIEGKLSASSIKYNGINFGEFTSEISTPTDNGPELKGRLSASPELPGLSTEIQCRASNDFKQAELSFQSSARKENSFKSSVFMKKSPQMTLSGKIQASGTLSYKEGSDPHAEAKLSIKDGQFVLNNPSIIVDSLNLEASIPDLLTLKGSSAELGFEKLRSGSFKINDAKLKARAENASLYVIDDCKFKFCEGDMSFSNLTIRPGMQSLETTVFCENISLPLFLDQFGIGSAASGDGKISGKLPLKIDSQGKLNLNGGYLSSNTGESGKIKLTGMEFLTAGASDIHLELSSEALKDFTYKWVRLTLSQDDDKLLIRMQTDGKPERPLPFVYKSEEGTFVRAEVNSKGSEFQGIRLDVNFRLPLNRSIETAKALSRIFSGK